MAGRPLVLCLIVLALSSGCLSGVPQEPRSVGDDVAAEPPPVPRAVIPDNTPGPASHPLAPDCTIPHAVRSPHGHCRAHLDVTAAADAEVDIATHPTDPRTLLVTWHELVPGGWTGWIAVTTDAGETWRTVNVEELTPPNAPEDVRHTFDLTAAFTPDGTALVLYTEEKRPGVVGTPWTASVLLARSTDLGASWAVTGLSPVEGQSAWDRPTLAVAPDDGTVYATAMSIPGGFMWFWRSTDSGASWEPPVLLNPPLREDTQLTWGRALGVVGAGPRGLVAVAAHGVEGHEFTVSLDSGDTWSAWKPAWEHPPDSQNSGDPFALGGPDARALYHDAGDTLLRAPLAGDASAVTGDDTPVARAPEGYRHAWVSASAHASGAHVVLQALLTKDGTGSATQFTLVEPDGRARTLLVGGPVAGSAAETGGDHYGGIATAADGSVWLAWSEPVEGTPTVTLARIPLAGA